MIYNVSKNLTLDVELSKTKDYKICLDAIEYLRLSGMVEHAAGNCIAMSDLIQHTLREFNISSRMVECKLVMAAKDQGKITEFKYMGFNGTSLNSKFVDTHVVIVTETDIPMIIDLSISHMLTNGRTWIVERLVSDEPEILTKIDLPECTITYSHKKTIRLLGLHQTTLVERVEQELQTRKKLTTIQKIMIVLGIITVINFALNTSILVLKYTVTAPTILEIKDEVVR